MWNFVRDNWNEIGVAFTVLSFMLTLLILAFTAVRYVSLRNEELRNRRYERYHSILMNVSRGFDANGLMKLVSQRAFIYELRHFPEYAPLTKRLLESLLNDWKNDPEKNAILSFEIQDTINSL